MRSSILCQKNRCVGLVLLPSFLHASTLEMSQHLGDGPAHRCMPAQHGSAAESSPKIVTGFLQESDVSRSILVRGLLKA